MPRFEVEPQRSIYYEHYRGQRLPVVLLHGWGSTARIWDCVVAALLARDHTVVVLDQRCHGRSDMDFENVTIAALVRDVAKLVEAIGLDRVVLNGWSMGGTVAIHAGEMLAERLAGLIVTCSLPRATWACDWPWGMPAADFEALASGAVRSRLSMFTDMAYASFSEPNPRQIDWCVRMKLESGPRAGDIIRDLVGHDGRAAARSIEVPTLVVGADRDAIVSRQATEAVAALFPRARLAMVAGSGHTPMIEAVEAYTAVLHEYLDCIESDARG